MCIHSAREFSDKQIDDMRGLVLDKVADRMLADAQPMGRCRYCENRARRVLDRHEIPQDGICVACQRAIDESVARHRARSAERARLIDEPADTDDPEMNCEFGTERPT